VKTLLLIHASATLMLVGLIWLIQLVHYPGFGWVGPERFVEYEGFHTRAITPLVLVLMGTELVTGGLLLGMNASSNERVLLLIGAALMGVIWLQTAFIAVPLHGRLASGYDADLIARLVATNWIRTLAWTGRAGIVVALLWPRLR
jgi:hypothetical protein